MLYQSIKDIKIIRTEDKWPSGKHYWCQLKSDESYKFYIDVEEYELLSTIDSLELSKSDKSKLIKSIDTYAQMKYSDGYDSGCVDVD